MKLLADGNFPGFAVGFVRDSGQHVEWIAESSSGATGSAGLKLAQEARAVLLTFDKNLGELAVRDLSPSDCGIILFRVPDYDPPAFPARMSAAFAQGLPWIGHISVIRNERIRMRALR
ncbi:MAG: DUF5615 family PIN-like protein [Bryobacterales bacterium]|jgi:hypothetical protein|nr:DUF5615 family PIN-like protein [Bryobacterales bacterium]